MTNRGKKKKISIYRNKEIKRLWNIIFPVLKNKYVLTLIIFFLWILLFDRNNLIERHRNLKKLHQLEKEKKDYIERIRKDKKQFDELRSSNENLEKFAREQYFMKKEDEDIFIVKEVDE